MKKQLWTALSVGLIALIVSACGTPAAATEVIEAALDEPTEEPAEEMTEKPVEEATEEPTSTPRPTATLDPSIVFHPVKNTAVVTTPTQWSDPGSTIYHDGMFYMFANSFSGFQDGSDPLLYVSEDGIAFDLVSDGALFARDDVSFGGHAITATSVLVEEDGTWVLYFHGWEAPTSQAPSRVGRATAPAPEGPWTLDPNPVLDLGPPGSWDDMQAHQASVVKTDDGYVMFYSGRSEESGIAIGRATSPDGINWTKDPEPIMQASGNVNEWDGVEVWQPRVQLTPDGYVMLYRATGNLRSFRHGLAFSEDGITWYRFDGNPVIQPEDVSGGQHTYFTDLVYADGRYFVFWELSKEIAPVSTGIFASVHEGSLP